MGIVTEEYKLFVDKYPSININMSTEAYEYNQFLRLYKNAVRDKRETFMFKGQEILVSYAKHYIEAKQSKIIK